MQKFYFQVNVIIEITAQISTFSVGVKYLITYNEAFQIPNSNNSSIKNVRKYICTKMNVRKEFPDFNERKNKVVL